MKKNADDRFSVGALIVAKLKNRRPKIVLGRSSRQLEYTWKYTVLDLLTLKVMLLSEEYINSSYELIE